MSTGPKPPLPASASLERRREPRFPAQFVEGHVTVIYPFAESVFPCTILEVSRGGMRLQVTAPIFAPSRVRVDTPRQIVFAEVRHCRQIGPDIFHVGLKVEDVCGKRGLAAELDTKRFRPKRPHAFE